MNMQLFIQGLLEIGISLLTGLFIFFASFICFNILTKDINEIEELKKNNIAISILISSFIFGIMLLIRTVIEPATDMLQRTINSQQITFYIILISILRIIIIYIIAALFSFIILWISIKFFMFLTKRIKEMDEIKNDNYSIALVTGILIISISIILIHPLSKLLDGFVTPPSINNDMKEPIMNLQVFFNGLIESIIAIFAAVFIYLTGLKAINIFLRKMDEDAEIKKNNFAAAIMVSSFIFAMMILIRRAVEPSYAVFENSIENGINMEMVLFSIGQIIIFFILSALFSFIILWLAIKAFMIFTTSIDEIAEIKKKNIAVAILIAVFVISAALIVEHGLGLILDSLVRYPKVGKGLLDISNF